MHARLALLASVCVISLTFPGVLAKTVTIRDSPISLPLARRFNMTGVPSILKQDQARAKAFKSGSLGPTSKPRFTNSVKSPLDIDATNVVVQYVANVGVGTPPTFYSLIVDTGSSNTWVGADKPFVRTSSTVDTGEEVAIEYGSGLFIGEQVIDTVTIGDFVIKNQGIGAASFALGFQGVDGILGLGPVDLTEGSGLNGGTVPTVIDNAVAEGLIFTHFLSISFEPTNTLEVTNGDLTFGNINVDKFIPPIGLVPVTSTFPSSLFLGFDQSITYGSAGIPILSTTAGMTDSGTTLLLIATDALAKYEAITGAVPDPTTGLLKITPSQFSNLESLFFHVGGNTYEFTANAQIWPRALNTAIGGDPESIYLAIGDIGSNSGSGLDFINGMVFLERFYCIYEEQGDVRTVGFANTQFTHATTN